MAQDPASCRAPGSTGRVTSLAGFDSPCTGGIWLLEEQLGDAGKFVIIKIYFNRTQLPSNFPLDRDIILSVQCKRQIEGHKNGK